ncbi:hypothetical protein E2562_020978 [Oryza meyeriana var. granulata]|uniref:At1g61320/AtMIF1 LRR domain-containing protein n=1 Tax=Oryza meyeriana var. granulata TaxID=110450 RepID=A0A6G1DYM6_9ORYZ|nr:hypothetical protein E2562_020978 [Oryza meyeriana var. granulata]
MHDQILALLPLDEAVRTSVLSPSWRDAVRWLLEGHSIEVVFNPRGTQEEEKLTRLEEQPARHLRCYSLVVNHSIDRDSAALIRRFLVGAHLCTVERLYVHLRSKSARHSVVFYFRYLNPHIQTLTLRGINFSGRSFGWGSTFAHLTSIHLNSVGFRDNYFLGMLSMCPVLRVLKLLYCDSLGVVTISAPNLQRFTVAECDNLKRVVLGGATRLRSYHYSGRPNSFYIPPGADMFTDLYICSASVQMFGTPQKPGVTAERVVPNIGILSFLRGAGANAELAILNNFQSLRELQLLMFELKAVDLDNIYVFLRTCHRPNLKELFVQLPTPTNWPFGEDLPGEQQEEQPEVGLDNLEVAKIMNFNWRHYELQLVAFLLRKGSPNHTLLLVSPRSLKFYELGLHQEDLSLIQAARASGQLVVAGILGDHAVYRPVHSKIYKKF